MPTMSTESSGCELEPNSFSLQYNIMVVSKHHALLKIFLFSKYCIQIIIVYPKTNDTYFPVNDAKCFDLSALNSTEHLGFHKILGIIWFAFGQSR